MRLLDTLAEPVRAFLQAPTADQLQVLWVVPAMCALIIAISPMPEPPKWSKVYLDAYRAGMVAVCLGLAFGMLSGATSLRASTDAGQAMRQGGCEEVGEILTTTTICRQVLTPSARPMCSTTTTRSPTCLRRVGGLE